MAEKHTVGFYSGDYLDALLSQGVRMHQHGPAEVLQGLASGDAATNTHACAHTHRWWNMGFDLCTLKVARGAGGLHRSDQSGRMVECLWSSAGHLACISGQTTTGKRLQYMHTFMRGCKCTQHRFLFLFFFFF